MKFFSHSVFLFLTSGLLLLSSCRDEQEGLEGCTDPEALNYDPKALVADSSSCEYPPPPSELVIWSGGEEGEYGGEEFLGVINVAPCKGSLDTMTLNPNDTLDPGPFSMILERDSANEFGLVASLTNPRKMDDYADGELQIDLMEADPERAEFEFKTFLHGQLCNQNHHPCGQVCSSRYLNVSTRHLNDSTMQTLHLPVPDFEDATFGEVDHIMGVRGNVSSGSDTIFAIREIRLVP